MDKLLLRFKNRIKALKYDLFSVSSGILRTDSIFHLNQTQILSTFFQTLPDIDIIQNSGI
jgi:hypothetical protein